MRSAKPGNHLKNNKYKQLKIASSSLRLAIQLISTPEVGACS